MAAMWFVSFLKVPYKIVNLRCHFCWIRYIILHFDAYINFNRLFQGKFGLIDLIILSLEGVVNRLFTKWIGLEMEKKL